MESFVNSQGFRMVKIAAGTFQMGGDAEGMDPAALPVHQVTLTQEYYLSKEPVTVEQYEVYEREVYGGVREKQRILGYLTGITYEEASEYVSWLARKEGMPYHLPTEAQWEYAARNRDTVEIDRMCDPRIREWCYDWYAPYGDLPQTDPAGPINGRYRCVRGGYLDNPSRYQAYHQEPFYRCAMPPGYRHFREDKENRFGCHPIGFRVAMGELPVPSGWQAPSGVCIGVKQKTESYRKAGPPADKPYFRKRYLFPVPPDNCTAQEIRCSGFSPVFRHHHHSPALTVAANGDLICTVYSTYHEYDAGSGLVGARLRVGEDQWEYPDIFLDPVGVNDHAPLLHTRPDGTIYHFWGWPQLDDAYPFQYTVSGDNGETWSEERYPLFRNKAKWVTPQPINTCIDASDGTFYLASDSSAQMMTDDTGVQRTGAASVLWRSRDGLQTWENPGSRTAGRHTTAVELKDGAILALGGKNTDIDGYMPAAVTRDGGDSYQVFKTCFPALNSGQRPSILRLFSGRLVVCGDYQTKKNKKPKELEDRAGSYAAWSEDEGVTWHFKQLWGTQTRKRGEGQFGNASTLGYSVMKQSPDGLIHIVCSNVHPLLHLCFNECWLTGEEQPQPPEEVLTASFAGRLTAPAKEYREYYENGSLRCRYSGGIADDGRFLLDGPETFYYPDGRVMLRENFRLGCRTGSCEWYDPQGFLIRRILCPKEPGSVPEERLETFWPQTGKVKTTVLFRGRRAEGEACRYDRNGERLETVFYKNGKLEEGFDSLER